MRRFYQNITLDDSVEIVPASDSSTSIPGNSYPNSMNRLKRGNGKRLIRYRLKPEDPGMELKPGYSADL
jgi:hypothetical protein